MILLLLSQIRVHPVPDDSKSKDGKIQVMFLTKNTLALFHSLDQEVIRCELLICVVHSKLYSIISEENNTDEGAYNFCLPSGKGLSVALLERNVLGGDKVTVDEAEWLAVFSTS
jgi:hypothetical protein